MLLLRIILTRKFGGFEQKTYLCVHLHKTETIVGSNTCLYPQEETD